MSETQALIHIDYTTRKAVATQPAAALKEVALSTAALIGKVTNEAEQLLAVTAQGELARIKKAVEKSEDAAKAPLNELRSAIIELRKSFLADIEDEGNRIAALVGEYQEKERARMLAEARLKQRELDDLERKRLEAIAAAKTVEKQDEINEAHSRVMAEVSRPVAPPQVRGQIVRTDWDIQVTDIWLLARAHPSCVSVSPRLSDIKSLLDAGMKVPGVSAVKKTTSTVRAPAERRAIEA